MTAKWLTIVCALMLSPAAIAQPAERALDVGGVTRGFLYSNPSGRPGPLPTVIAMHGGGGTARALMGYFGWEPVASREGFAVVYPQGLDNAWNDGRGPEGRARQNVQPGDDVAFLVALADMLVREGRADRRRIYLTGVSNGGFMTVHMACVAADRFAAFAPIIAAISEAEAARCRPGRPVPFVLIAGTADRFIPYDGGTIGRAGTVRLVSAPATVGLFARLNGCTGTASESRLPDTTDTDMSTVTLVRHTGCAANTWLYRVDGGGHQPPGFQRGPQAALRDSRLGPRNRDIDSAEELWRFFRSVTR